MSETMIERVARAIGAVFIAEHGRLVNEALSGSASSMTATADDALMLCARAAIKAMREPSKGMISDGLYAIQSHMDSTTDSIASYDIAVEGTAYHGWVAMIDAALSESSN